MRRYRAFRFGVITAGLILIAVSISGCLDARESILGRYDADKDQFVFLNIYQRMGGQNAQDFDYLEKLWKNRDHLITPPIPSFLGKISYLRISDTEFAKLNLQNAAHGEISPSPLPLDKVTVKPGQFFLRGSDALCYYDQIVVPGSFADATLKLLNLEAKKNIDTAIAAERDRRVKGGAVVSWAAFRKATVENLRKQNVTAEANPDAAKPDPAPNAAAPEPAANTDVMTVLSNASLEKLEKGFSDVWLVRDKAIFRATISMDEADAKETLATIAAVRAELADEVKRPGHDPDLDKQVSVLAVIESGSPKPGVIELSVDATELFPRVEAMMDPKAALPAPSRDDAARGHDALAAIKAKEIPINEKVTVEQIVADFHARKLEGHPPEKSVRPGEGIVERD
ncbi:MAG: hypothetical protein JWN24_3721 [Phycisphaerales bacterium]|nr:hypothetical protein [Phycisphaerales bacterium]